MGNVDAMLRWFDEYQIDCLKSECEELLLTMPCSIERLIQARSFNLKVQYQRCLEAVSDEEFILEFNALAEHPDILKDLIPLVVKSNSYLASVCSIIDSKLDTPEQLMKALPFIMQCFRFQLQARAVASELEKAG